VGNAASFGAHGCSSSSSSSSMAPAELAAAAVDEQELEAPAGGGLGVMNVSNDSSAVGHNLGPRGDVELQGGPGSLKQADSLRVVAAEDSSSAARGPAGTEEPDSASVTEQNSVGFGTAGRGSRSSSTGGATATAGVARRGSGSSASQCAGLGSQESLRAEPALAVTQQPVLQHTASRLGAVGAVGSTGDVDDSGEEQGCDAKLKDE
jgi:hypothetical protein